MGENRDDHAVREGPAADRGAHPRLVVGISGATGIVYALRALELARKAGFETHLVVTPAGQQTRAFETDLSAADLAAMADVAYRPADIGVEPGLPWVGGMPIPEGEDEAYYLGALFGEGIELVPAETVDLLVPATAEIVIEGHIAVDETVMEGPFNEFPGYNATDGSPKAVFHVSAVTYQDGAIQPVVAAGPPVEEDHTIIGTTSAAEILHLLREAGLPISSAWYNFEAAVHWLTLAVRQDWHETTGIGSHELVDRIAGVIFHGKPSVNAPKILLVEDDVDITDLNQVVWAFATRSHPDVERGAFHYPPAVSDQLAVYLSPEESRTFSAGKLIYSCLLADLYPAGSRPVKGSFENGWPLEVRERVPAKWAEYGFR